jgi:urease accessory protein UreF
MTQQQLVEVTTWLQRQAVQTAVREADQRSGRALLARAKTVKPPAWREQARDWRGRWCR